MLIDTHAHLYAPDFEEDKKSMLQRAKNEGVGKIYLPNIDEETIEATISLARSDPGFMEAMMGLHPCYVKKDYKKQLATIEEALHSQEFAGIGESGLDFFRDKSLEKEQKDALHMHSKWAKERKKPLILHSRGAIDETISFISKEQDGRLFGIFHCFTGTLSQAEAIVDMGFYLGIGGILTFKNSKLDETLRNITPEHIVLETDAPYLAPHPHRGKRNESAYLRLIADKVAEVYDIDSEEVARITTENALKVFGRNEIGDK